MVVDQIVIVCVVSKLVLMFGYVCVSSYFLLGVLTHIISVYGTFSDVAGRSTGERFYIFRI
jgi:hypothetical protein